MDQEIKNRLQAQEEKIDAIFKSVEKTRKYFLWIFWATIIGFVVPLIGLAFVIPSFLSTYTSSFQGLM